MYFNVDGDLNRREDPTLSIQIQIQIQIQMKYKTWTEEKIGYC